MKTTYQIDPAHSSAHFSVRHMMISNVRGGFRLVKGSVIYDSDDPSASTIEAEIDAGSISTMNEQRDAHLKSAEFMNAENHPTITFKSSKVQVGAPGEAQVTGDLTIRGITRQVVLKVEGPSKEGKDPWGNLRIGASATTTIKRADFGLTWNAPLETGGIVLGEDLKIEIDVEMIKAAAVSAA